MGKIYEALQQAAAKSQPKGETSEEKSLLLVKLAEIKEISDKLFEQIEKKVEVMKTLEASVDEKVEVMKTLEASVNEKIVALKKLGQGGIGLETIAPGTDQRPAVLSLKNKGLSSQEIAATLGLPIGEVELIFNLNKDYRGIPDEPIIAQRDGKTLPQKLQTSRNLPKIVARKLLWTTASLVLGAVIIYFVFLQKNNAPLTPLHVEQPNNAQQKENSDIGKTTASDLIREKYNAQLDTQTDKQVSQPVQREARKIETTAAKEIKRERLKRTVAVVTNAATIRANPSLDSRPVSWVSQGIIFEIQDEVVDDNGKKWYKVVTSDGKEGWLADKVVRELS